MSALAEARAAIAANPKQQEAFETKGHCVVLAPPGSGKTMLLTARLAQDFLEVIAAPHGAACITYGGAAAAELDSRLTSYGIRRRANLFIGTVHGFALNAILRPYAPVVGRPGILEARVADAATRKRIMEEAIASVYGPNENTFAVDTTVQRRRRHIVHEEDERMFGGERIAEVEGLYSRGLDAEGCIDFDDMVRLAVELVQSHDFVRAALTARFPKLFVDEYQDLGPGLHYLVTSLCFDQGGASTLFAVADPEQCIYVFTGAAPELVEELTARSSVAEVTLGVNYRCANEIIRKSMTALDEPIEVEGRREGGKVEVHQVEGWIEGQAKDALTLITQATSEGTPLENIAILCVSNPDCQRAASVLSDAELPVFVRSSDQYASTPASTFLEGLAEWVTVPRGSSGFPLAALLGTWRSLLGDKWQRKKSTELVTMLLGVSDSSEPALDFVQFVADMGLLEALSARIERQEDAQSILQMQSNLSSGGSLDGLSISQLGDRAKAKNRIHVITMHASKGLEFDHIFVLGLEHGRLPFYNAEGWEVVQARRQFYVALTRARHSVHLYYTGWQKDRYGRVHRDGPSRFLKQLTS